MPVAAAATLVAADASLRAARAPSRRAAAGAAAASAAAAYLLLVRVLRYRRVARIAQLGAHVTPGSKHFRWLANAPKTLEMPWLDGKAIELGFFRTFAVPTIARLLLATDEFKRDADKRAEGTDIVSPESVERSGESTRGEATLRRLLAVRGKDELSKSDYLYILSIFVLEPRMWIDAYEWRPLHKHELIARCNYWIEEGKRMGIPDIPATLEEFQVFQQTYEAQHMRFHPDSRTLSLDAIDVFAHGLLPRWIVPLCLPVLRTAVLALLEPRVVAALGFKQPPASARAACRGALRLRGWLVRHFLLPRADGRAET